MERLSHKKYWELVYKSEDLEYKLQPSDKKLKILLKRLLGKRMVEYLGEYMIRCYADYLLWEVIYKKYMPKVKKAKILEIGSAPGSNLVRLSQRFGYIPYGVEYSESGVKLNREIFISHNINPDNVIHADFLSDEFHREYRGYFDIVISGGFIEHFTNIEDIIDKHIDLLKKGGYLIVGIPNLRGLNYFLAWIFHKEFLAMHNIDIMQKRKFSELFDKKRVLPLFCNYYGTFNFWLFNEYFARHISPTRFVLGFCCKLQLILNVVFRLLFRDKGRESSSFSPYLLYIGVKK